jgi:hypothetical protein
MARIRVESDDEELPNLADILKTSKSTNRKPVHRSTNSSLSGEIRSTSLHKSTKSLSRESSISQESEVAKDEAREKTKAARRQRPLKKVEANSVLLQPLKNSTLVPRLDKLPKRRGNVLTKPSKEESQKTVYEDGIKEQTEDIKALLQDLCIKSIASKESDTALSKHTPHHSEENTLDEIDFWSKPRPPRSPPQDRPPPETPRAARQKARTFKLPPLLAGGRDSTTIFKPQKETLTGSSSRPTSSSSADHAALLT